MNPYARLAQSLLNEEDPSTPGSEVDKAEKKELAKQNLRKRAQSPATLAAKKFRAGARMSRIKHDNQPRGGSSLV